MRPIDAVSLSEGIELHRQSTYQKCEMDRQWAVDYNAGLDRALYSIAYAKTIAPPPNDPLTLKELRGMDGEPVWGAFSDGSGRYMIIQWHNSEFFKTFECGFLLLEEYGKTWLAYRRRPEGQKDLGGET